ncbi:MAG: PadR family transcriptional regulator [Paraclostridium sp.]
MELNKEVLKGHIDTLILAILEKNDSYGFEIAKIVLDKTMFELKDGTMYISLKRLEAKGLIESYWQSNNGPGNRRKYYKITKLGVEALDIKAKEWNFVKNIIDKFLEGREKNGSDK